MTNYKIYRVIKSISSDIGFFITEGKKDDLVSYFGSLPAEVREGIQAISMDMSRSYCYSVLQCLPFAKPIIDRFNISKQLHKNVEDLSYEEALRLILACTKYERIYELNYLKEEFREFFNISSREDAEAFLEYYKNLAYEYNIPELKTFCKTIDNWLPYIFNYYDFPISNGPIEGNSHKIKNIKRRAYGYRNHDNFELRVMMEFECA